MPPALSFRRNRSAVRASLLAELAIARLTLDIRNAAVVQLPRRVRVHQQAVALGVVRRLGLVQQLVSFLHVAHLALPSVADVIPTSVRHDGGGSCRQYRRSKRGLSMRRPTSPL